MHHIAPGQENDNKFLQHSLTIFHKKLIVRGDLLLKAVANIVLKHGQDHVSGTNCAKHDQLNAFSGTTNFTQYLNLTLQNNRFSKW